MKIIEMHFYRKIGKTWSEDSYTSENQLGQQEMLQQYSSAMTWKYIHKSPAYLPVKTEYNYSTGCRTITFRERWEIGGPVMYKRVFVVKD